MPTRCGGRSQKTLLASPEGSQQGLPEQAGNDIQSRLQRATMLLAIIDRRRLETRDANLGAGLERYLLNRELRELEELPEPAVAVSQASTSPVRVRRPSAVLLSKAGSWLRRKS